MSFRLETTVKGFHFWIVFSALQRIGEAQAIHQEQLSAPLITGKDRILVMMQDHPLIWDIILPKGRFSSLPSLQCQGGIATLAYSPSIYHLAVMADNGHQVSFAQGSLIVRYPTLIQHPGHIIAK